MKTTLKLYGVNYETIELDEDNALKISMNEGQKFLSHKTGSGTVPHLFVDGNSVGLLVSELFHKCSLLSNAFNLFFEILNYRGLQWFKSAHFSR